MTWPAVVARPPGGFAAHGKITPGTKHDGSGKEPGATECYDGAPSPGICCAAVVDCRGGRNHRIGTGIAGRMGASAVRGYLLGACAIFQLRLVAGSQRAVIGMNL